MQPLPTEDMRSNLGTWAVPNHYLPTLGHWMHDALPNEPYDPHFYGQQLETYYFDTRHFDLRKARLKKDQYCTLRVRCYPGGVYALSAKTESEKFRIELPGITAQSFLTGQGDWQSCLPVNILSRLIGICDPNQLQTVVQVCCRRYAIEDADTRFTLDVHVHTENGKCLPFNVLEMKGDGSAEAPSAFQQMNFNPIKLSKFLWATEI